jgi:hypothetical protein
MRRKLKVGYSKAIGVLLLTVTALIAAFFSVYGPGRCTASAGAHTYVQQHVSHFIDVFGG